MNYIIGIDVGTTNTKAVLYDLNGHLLAKASRSYRLYQDEIDQAEEDPEEIFQAVVEVLQAVIKCAGVEAQNILAISWSAQQHSLLALDQNFKPLTRVITWADNRAMSVTQKFKNSGQGLKFYHSTGLPIHPMGPIYKLFWLKEVDPELFRRTSYWVGIKEYIIWRLTGQLQIDESMAASTGLFNLNSLQWDQDILKTVGVRESQLPEVVPITAAISGVHLEISRQLDLNPAIKIVMGATDGALSTLGIAGTQEKTLTINVGTSAAVREVVDQPILDSDARLFCYPIVKGKYLVGGPINNGGIVFNWARETLLDGEAQAFDEVIKLACSAPAGSNGLIFYPYLGGERAPLWDADARGTFVGLNRNHSKADLIRSVMEGIIFNVYLVAQATKLDYTKILATGGFVQSDLSAQILADVFEQRISIPTDSEAGCFAAMFIARLSLGFAKELSDISNNFGSEKQYLPADKITDSYRELKQIFIRFAKNNTNLDHALADYQRKYHKL
ncbi:gluconokinase [Xylocopilactobacillus apicola]|uniref:Gluconate kinase n=1 Tax=Xylocopilactobacillus apicola TaxID=2932184 RepID=A0AAU9D8G9_9LACO|nr:gluconokinase [Xylocopilactobacillus apicola]BDR57760.1 gluconate kinase [Xylocopilactobacillus apicola]